jgi:SAM-dependent methyltransferase
MTEEMINLARKNAVNPSTGQAPANIEFHLSTIDQLPLADASVDCIISNCVINLAPDKPKVFAEMARVLKPGGRVAISDIAIKKPMPEALSENLMAYVGCIAGAIQIDEYRAGLLDAGFSAVEIKDSGADLNAYANVEGQSACCSPSMEPASGLAVIGGCCEPASTQTTGIHSDLQDLLSRYDVNDFAASVKVYAIKG